MTEPLRIFIGWDPRQPVSYHTLAHSIIANSSRPVAITPLVQPTLKTVRAGLTPFTWSRFLVPWLCGYRDWALFLDVDMMVRGDIADLFDLADVTKTVMVSKNPLKFEWASAMLFNCEACRVLSPKYVETGEGLHKITWAHPDQIGDLPPEWNHLVGYDAPRDDAKLVHFTQGIPAFVETVDSEYADEWRHVARAAFSSQPWATLMGNSVHAKPVYERLLRDGKIKQPAGGPGPVEGDMGSAHGSRTQGGGDL